MNALKISKVSKKLLEEKKSRINIILIKAIIGRSSVNNIKP